MKFRQTVLHVKLKGLDQDNEKRREIASYYRNHINKAKLFCQSVEIRIDYPCLAYFVVRTKNEKTAELSNEKGNTKFIHYPIPPHKQLAYKEWNNLTYPISEQIHNERNIKLANFSGANTGGYQINSRCY